ncbi:hypothetical protein GLOTRDRAFT_134584 [Gloeophyllum trabeum ATCC 11539]|uniref:Uncharacterized protein n=1 Tax=Gloeophyllum trabeum (strain ATCC 11539 / FP-39264 / Madison 617) TaxID=670483 RepID=S7R604_GLOTA|nr:uncharacterized protein GLOTRDRAFT_134584 [Gloeophyllum trabeum ATCC 11539]EPQ49810.1 hypothetical protein GLOTRDRAFT_134584 [Gloeophyllum trabeum ATCC 11539]
MDHIRRVDIKVSRKALRQWVVANPVNPDFPAPILEELQLKKVADNLDAVPDANEHTLLSIFRSQRLRDLTVHKFTYRAARALFLPTVEKLSLVAPKESGTSTLQFQQDLLTMPNLRRLTVDLSLSPSANMVDVQLDRLEYLDLTIKKAKDARFLRTVTAHRLRDARIIVEAPDKDIPSILRSLAGLFNVVAVQRHLRCAVFRARNAHGLYVSLTEEEMSTTKGIRLYLKNGTLDEHLFRLLTMYMALCLDKVQRLYIEPDLCVPLVRNAATVKMNAEGLLLTIEAMQELRLLQISMKLTRIDNLEDGSAVPCPRLETVVVEDVGVDEALFLSFLIAPNLQDVDLDITALGGDIHNVVESIAPLLDHVAKNCQGYDANICAQSGQSLELTFTGLETETDAVRLEFLGKDIQNRALTAIARELGSSLQVVREFTVADGEGYERNSWATWYGLFEQMDAVRTLCIEGDASKVFDSGLAFRPGGQQGSRPVFPQMYSLILENVWFRPRKKKNGPRAKKTFVNDLIRSFQHRQQAKSLKYPTIVKGTNIRLADINKLQTLTRYLSSDRAVRK